MPRYRSRPSHSPPFQISRLQFHRPGRDLLSGLMLALLLIQGFLFWAGGPEQVPGYYRDFGLSWAGFSSGKVWQLATYGLLHADWLHLLINLLMLWLVGGRVVQILGYGICFQAIALGALAGGCLHLLTGLLMLRNGYEESYLVGISGSCLALLLVLTTISPHSRTCLLPISGRNLGLGLIIAELLLWLVHPGMGLPGFSRLGQQMVAWSGDGLFQISHACHLGGALAGWWLAKRTLLPAMA